ncbi:MAG: alpha/beta hydrolase, partial [Halanaerobium sp.]|nr:alpha/beta hydrolase [Halanaerobium sp.]
MPLLPLPDGNEIYFTTRGSGETVALLNGIMMSTGSWELQAEPLSNEYQVLLHDFLGQGRSSKPASGYSMNRHCEDLVALLDHIGTDRVHLAGVSYGGEVAQAMAALYPERVKSLVLATTVSEIHPLLRAMGQAWIAAAEMEDGGRFFDIILPFVYSEDFINNKQSWLAERKKLYAESVTSEWFQGFLGLMDSFLELNLTPLLEKIKAPTLVLAAEKDLLKPEDYSK